MSSRPAWIGPYVDDRRAQRRIRRDGRDLHTCTAEAASVVGSLCAICREAHRPEDTVTVLPCMHAFHEGCLGTWLETNASCPLCRERIRQPPGPAWAAMPWFELVTTWMGTPSFNHVIDTWRAAEPGRGPAVLLDSKRRSDGNTALMLTLASSVNFSFEHGEYYALYQLGGGYANSTRAEWELRGAQHLIELGAWVGVRNHAGKTAYDLVMEGWEEAVWTSSHMMRSIVSRVALLLVHGATPEQFHLRSVVAGQQPLCEEYLQPRCDLCDLLVAHGAVVTPAVRSAAAEARAAVERALASGSVLDAPTIHLWNYLFRKLGLGVAELELR